MSTATAAAVLAGSIVDVLGGRARSVILHGSLAAGGFRPGRSDIDLLAVVDGALPDAQIDALVRRVHRADAGDAAAIDLHVITTGVAGRPVRTPPLELYVGRHTGLEAERRVPAAPDLPAELSMARSLGRALRGAAPHEVLAPVPARWIVDRGRHWLTTWQSLTGDTAHAAFMVLTACRIWHFAAENEHCPKIRAGEWALGRDPSLTAVRQAIQRYEGGSTPVDEAGIAAVLDRVLRETG
jgi:predicted nucleotidyltransferase